MNLYFLVEGKSTEKKVYPKLVDYFFDGALTQVKQVHQATQNNFFVFTGNGYPRIFTHVLRNTIVDINALEKYQHLFLCIDADENSTAERHKELAEYLTQFEREGLVLNNNCELHLIVQNRCIETWFLGNRKVYKSNPSDTDLAAYQSFYKVKERDPELMPMFPTFDLHAAFHLSYLTKMLLERRISYTKKKPRDVAENHYIEELINRAEETTDIASFYHFYTICQQIKAQIN
jgi:hypothetical protein